MDISPTGLRVLREVAQTGSFTAAAPHTLGYTQSAVSRQMAALERAVDRRLVERRRDGVALTPAGARLLVRANRVLDELDAAVRDAEVAAGPSAWAPSIALAGPIPAALAALPPGVVVTVREGTTAALTRALRAGTLDLAVLAREPPFRPPDAESPALALTVLSEGELRVAVGPRHRLARRRAVEIELAGEAWVASGPAGEAGLGVWPGLAERPDVRYVVRDWLARLRLVAAGLAVTTVAPLVPLPEGVRAVAVRGEPQETRRLVLAHAPGPLAPAARAVADALCDVRP